jgi:regulator of RNase E activity RraA
MTMTMGEAATVCVADEILQQLQGVSAGTACGELHKVGISRSYMKGLVPVFPVGAGKRVIGRAVTVRFLPAREDMPETWRSDDVYRRALDRLEPNDFLVVDGMGWDEGALVGDILGTRIRRVGGVGVAVDGAIRDSTGLREVGLPVFARCLHASPSRPYLMSMDVNVPIQCGRVLVLPGDVILADDDGVVVVPSTLAAKIAQDGVKSEQMELFVRQKVAEGISTSEIYPQTLLKR